MLNSSINVFDTKIARPYAKAVFAFAMEQEKLEQWSKIIASLAAVANEGDVQKFIINPNVTIEQTAELFKGWIPASAGMTEVKNLIDLLATNRRLGLLPEIDRLYGVMLAAEKQELNVAVVSALPLSEQQQTKLTTKLEQKFNIKVIPNYSEDKALLGGIIVKIGDRILDGSVLGRLESLRTKI
jgi:F-type H+-transporting ATPase subunit delta